MVKLTLVPLCKKVFRSICVCLGCLARITSTFLGNSLMVMSKSWGYRLKDCGVFKEHVSLFVEDYICGLCFLLGGKWMRI